MSHRLRPQMCLRRWGPWAPEVSRAAAAQQLFYCSVLQLLALLDDSLPSAVGCKRDASGSLRPLPLAALGAVLIAAVGVYGVFKMALYVASETGRSLNADKPALQAEGTAVQQQQQQQADGSVKAATALERKWTDVRLWRKWPGAGCSVGPALRAQARRFMTPLLCMPSGLQVARR